MIELWDGARSENWKSEVEHHEWEVNENWNRRLSGMQATHTDTKTKNEKRLSGMQATEIMNTEILKPEMPEILNFDFLEEKFKNEFLLSAGEAPATTAEEPDERRKLVRVEVPRWTVSRREVPDSQGGVRQHLLLRRRAGERNGNRDFCLARKAVRRADRFLSTVPVSLREHHQQREVGACKRDFVRKLKLEDHSNHKNWEPLEADGYGNPVRITV